MDKTNNFFLKMIFFFINFKLLLFHDPSWYCHLRSEVIQIVGYDNYDGFQRLNFIFAW
jgi:hypothetical protein